MQQFLKSVIQDLEGFLYDFDKGYDIYKSIKDIESAVAKLKNKIKEIN